MNFLFAFTGLVALTLADQVSTSIVMCYYDSKSFIKDAQARILPLDLKIELCSCTHLVYAYAGVQPNTYQMVLQTENLDLSTSSAISRYITNFKIRCPGSKVILSVGGDVGADDSEIYNQLLQFPQARTVFVKSAVDLAEQYGFNGIDFAWPLPKTEPTMRATLGSTTGAETNGTTSVDENVADDCSCTGFKSLIREMRLATFKTSYFLSITIMSNINASQFKDIPTIINLVDYLNLMTYDYYTPDRNPKEADFASPTYAPQNRNPLLNTASDVNYWLSSGIPSQKLVVALTTFARTWMLDSDSDISGVPPIHTDGPGKAGPYTKTEGLLSYPEVCSMLNNQRDHLVKVTDPSKRFGTYAYRLPDANGEGGIWLSYGDPETAGQKACYAKSKNLGGVLIADLAKDDQSGLCTGAKYPILCAAKCSL